MKEIVLLIISMVPVILLLRYIYLKDKNKEPKKLLLKLFVGGILSFFLVLIINIIFELICIINNIELNIDTMNLFELFIYVFIGIALVEEVCKWIITYKLSYNDSNFDEIYDIIIYSTFVSLGFAFFENLFYVFDNGIVVGLFRALLAVPSHACDGVFMGYFFGLAKLNSVNGYKDLEMKYLIFSILIPIITHGIYDYCLFTNNSIFMIVFFIFIVVTYITAIKKVKQISISEQKILLNFKNNYCTNCGYFINNNYCSFCGKKNV